MEKAKQAIKDFTSKSGHHDTTVHETVAPAVTQETVKPSRHENVTTAVDKEIHQDHYHTSVQPVVDKQIAPEQHTHQMAGVEHRTYDHGDSKDVEARLAKEAGQFKDQRQVTDTHHTHSVNPTVGGEHVHHHVHETIQPVVQREVVQPSVVHTTVPVHEVHHNSAQHHSASALPAVSMQDFKQQGGVLGGREERVDGFQGEPKSVGGALGSGTSTHRHHHGTDNITGSTGSGITGSSGTTGMTGTTGTTGTTGSTTTGTDTTKKASLLDKVNPSVDADGDGKKGFMK